MKAKKILSAVCVSALLAPLSIGLLGCKGGEDFNINAKDIYALSAASSVNYLLEMEHSGTQSTGTKLMTTTATTRPEALSNDNLKGIANCLNLFESVLQSGGVDQTTAKNTAETDAELSEYTFVMTISLPGVNETFKMYYNEVDTKTSVEIEDETEEVEVSTTLSGVMVAGSTRFDVQGKREFEQEGNEKESSIEFTTRSRKNNQNYIVIEQSVEEENGETEIEYEYKLYKDGSKVQDLEVEIEDENNKIELEFKLKNRTDTAWENTIYKVSKGNAEGEFKVLYSVNNSQDEIKIKKSTTGYLFEYSNGYTENITAD